ncbi:hypothetical protein QBC45DRAFT_416791 [Copromyces sp. CBS 386.78]|nr:hypothetical protein QBC45DRAFT_416791 [Copromyces sp. CBS 386.78]
MLRSRCGFLCPWFFLCASRSHPSPLTSSKSQKTASYRSSFSGPTSYPTQPQTRHSGYCHSLIASIANSPFAVARLLPHTFPPPLEKPPNGAIIVTKSTTSQNGTYEDNAQDKVPALFAIPLCAHP